jgi:hypothetical protein
MGPDARNAFDAFAKNSFGGAVLCTTHPYADFSFSESRLAAETAVLSRAWAAVQ